MIHRSLPGNLIRRHRYHQHRSRRAYHINRIQRSGGRGLVRLGVPAQPDSIAAYFRSDIQVLRSENHLRLLRSGLRGRLHHICFGTPFFRLHLGSRRQWLWWREFASGCAIHHRTVSLDMEATIVSQCRREFLWLPPLASLR